LGALGGNYTWEKKHAGVVRIEDVSFTRAGNLLYAGATVSPGEPGTAKKAEEGR